MNYTDNISKDRKWSTYAKKLEWIEIALSPQSIDIFNSVKVF